jgi:60 kDa SS-A/Ro ribonucleoprotein
MNKAQMGAGTRLAKEEAYDDEENKMVNATLFQTLKGKLLPPADARNAEGAPAYRLAPKHRLAQYAATGCLNDTYYAGADDQLETVLELSKEIDTRFIAQTAVYCRERGYMKDMPALLVAVLAARGAPELAPAFGRVIDNGRMLRNVVQILRSGATGRKSLGTRPKKLVQQWLNGASEQALLAAAVGNAPSLADVVKMVHPKPAEAWREAFFAWLIGKPFNADALPPRLQAFEAWKGDRSLALPEVPFQMLTAQPLTAADWAECALRGGWQMLRMNLNTLLRHGVFELPGMTQAIAERLRDARAIAKARVFPYQLMASYRAAQPDLPAAVHQALHDALELALANVPCIEGRVVVCPDVSGSMSSPATGQRGSATSQVRCIDVAALVAAAMLRKNPRTAVLPFAHQVVELTFDGAAPVLANAARLASMLGGGTNCSAPLAWLNQTRTRADLVVFVSDNQSWIDARRHGATATMQEWQRFKRRNPQAKLVCIDVTPYPTVQAQESEDVLNVGGFSDAVFDIVGAFAAGQLQANHWVGEIEVVAI